MKFITITSRFAEICQQEDVEFLKKSERRPHLLLVSLKYKGVKRAFAIPLRSNIPPNTPKNQYFPLPQRKTTKIKHRHGLHYIKMFPITSQYTEKFWTGNKKEYLLYQDIISTHIKEIVDACQLYLDTYESGIRPPYAVDIDHILTILK